MNQPTEIQGQPSAEPESTGARRSPGPMRLEELVAIARLAASARSAQREYFRTRSREHLIFSKDAEKKLDALLESAKAWLDQCALDPKPRQSKLFDDQASADWSKA